MRKAKTVFGVMLVQSRICRCVCSGMSMIIRGHTDFTESRNRRSETLEP